MTNLNNTYNSIAVELHDNEILIKLYPHDNTHEQISDGRHNHIKQCETFSIDASGISNGMVINLLHMQSKLKELITKVEKLKNIKITEIILSIPPEQIKVVHLSTCVKMQNKCKKSHITNMMNKVENLCKENCSHIIECNPSLVKIDNQVVSNPYGILGNKCEVTWNVIYSPHSVIKNFNNIFNNLHINITEYQVHEYQAINKLLSTDQKKIGSIVINMKDKYTLIYLFKENMFVKLCKLNIGFEEVISAISLKLQIDHKQAKILCKQYCSAILHEDDQNHHIKFTKYNNETEAISVYQFTKNTINHIKNIIYKINKKIRENHNMSNSYVLLYGDIAEISGIKNVADNLFQKDVILLNSTYSSISQHHPITEDTLPIYTPSKKGKNIFSRIYHSTLLGLKKIYDMIKE